MTFLKRTRLAFFFLVSFTGCDQFTYSLHSKRNRQKEKPSVVLLNKIIAYREEFNTWPYSKEAFTGKGGQYKNAFDGFPYQQMTFKIKDENSMLFYFSDHIKDVRQRNQSGQIDLNGYGGVVKFYKEKDKFIWKIKM